MSEKVYLLKANDNDDDAVLCGKLEGLLSSENLLDIINKRDVTAVKTHFGEVAGLGYVRPVYFKMLGDLIRKKAVYLS